MPEGPEVEAVRKTLSPHLTGRTFGRPWVSSLKLRTPTTSRALRFLEGQTPRALERHGKLLWFFVDDHRGAWVRLGMTGQLMACHQTDPVHPHTHVRIPLGGGDTTHQKSPYDELRYVDVRRFGEFVPFASEGALADERKKLGPDPITMDDADVGAVVEGLGRTARAIKDAILDQRVLAGVGNIYACEALFVAGISPLARGLDLKVEQRALLVEACRNILRAAVDAGGTTFSDYRDGEGNRGRFGERLLVFQREGAPCPTCRTPIARVVQGGRSTFFCPTCQPKLRRRRRRKKATRRKKKEARPRAQ